MSLIHRLVSRYLSRIATVFNTQEANPLILRSIRKTEQEVKSKQIPKVKKVSLIIEGNPLGQKYLGMWDGNIVTLDTSKKGLVQGGPSGKLSYEFYLLLALGFNYYHEVLKQPSRVQWVRFVRQNNNLVMPLWKSIPTEDSNIYSKSFMYSFANYVKGNLSSELEEVFERVIGTEAPLEDEVFNIWLDPKRADKIKTEWLVEGALSVKEAKEKVFNRLKQIFPLAESNLGRPLKEEDLYDLVGASAFPEGLEITITYGGYHGGIEIHGEGPGIKSLHRTLRPDGSIYNQLLVFERQGYDSYGNPTDNKGYPLEERYEQIIPEGITGEQAFEVIDYNDLEYDLRDYLEEYGIEFDEDNLEDEELKEALLDFLEERLPLFYDADILEQSDEVLYYDSEGVLWNEDGSLLKSVPKGTGSKLFAAQVQAAQKIGAPYIKCTAASGPGLVGYKVWNKLGYDGLVGKEIKIPSEYTLPVNKKAIKNISLAQQIKIIESELDTESLEEYFEEFFYMRDDLKTLDNTYLLNNDNWKTVLPPSFFAYTLSDMAESGDHNLEEWGIGPRWSIQALMSEGMSDWWDRNGVDWNATFDLNEDSRSLKILSAYIMNKSQGNINRWFHRVGEEMEDGVTQAGGTFDSGEMEAMGEIYREFLKNSPKPPVSDTIRLVKEDKKRKANKKS